MGSSATQKPLDESMRHGGCEFPTTADLMLTPAMAAILEKKMMAAFETIHTKTLEL
jgi:hypothetical protein